MQSSVTKTWENDKTSSLLCQIHCVKSVQIRIYFWSVFSCIRTEYRKIRTRNNFVFWRFSRSDHLSHFLKCAACCGWTEKWNFISWSKVKFHQWKISKIRCIDLLKSYYFKTKLFFQKLCFQINTILSILSMVLFLTLQHSVFSFYKLVFSVR